MMRFEEAKKVFFELYFLKKTLKKYRRVLRNGKFFLFPTMRAMVVNDCEYYDKANQYFNKKVSNSLRKKLVDQLNKLGIYRNTAISEQKYEAFYVANNYDKEREIKLFSFRRNKILTLCTNHSDYENQIFLYKKLHNCYNMPKITPDSQFANSYEISMVLLQTRPDEKYALKNIMASIKSYNERKIVELERCTVSDLISFKYENAEINSILESIYSKISTELLDKTIPLCQQHGDLSRDNLIYGEADGKIDFWWIDWEHIGKRVFFYDYYFYILNTALYFQDSTALENYINGNYSEDLKKHFQFFEVDFSSEKLKDYFLIFFVVFLKERVCDSENISALKMYYDFVNKFDLLVGE